MKLSSTTRSTQIQSHSTDKNMDNMSNQDRDVFNSFQAVVGDIVIAGCKSEFLPRAYILNNDGRTT